MREMDNAKTQHKRAKHGTPKPATVRMRGKISMRMEK